MEAPDKIYLTKNRIDVISQFFHSAPIIEDGFVNIEYIRKDALLEFLKKKVNEIEIAMETGADDPVLWGQRNAFKQVIDKINSM